MKDPLEENPPPDGIRAALAEIAPGSELLGVEALPGSYSNYTHLVRALDCGQELRYVVRRYKVFGAYDRGEKARREYLAFDLCKRNGIPAPVPVFLDETGEVLGIPGILSTYVPGAQQEDPPDRIAWAETMAVVLARIHAVPVTAADREYLLDADAEVSWFNRRDAPPEFMAAHPLGASVWESFRAAWPRRAAVDPGLVHIDYWPGNILWQDGAITAVVDWEEAAFGDPVIDVAYCRMDMVLRGWQDAADAFLSAYERAAGGAVENLGLWELAAAARPMFNPDGWITGSPAAERFAGFVENAIARIPGDS